MKDLLERPSRDRKPESISINDLINLLSSLQAKVEQDEVTTGPKHPMFVELESVNQEFDRYYRRSGMQHYKAHLIPGGITIGKYIEVIYSNKDQITPDLLVAPENKFKDKIDPVFAFILRAMIGPDIMTEAVYDKVRAAWCGDDIPHKVGDILKINDDEKFLDAFEKCVISPYDNVKLSILKDMGIMRDLVAGRDR